MGVVEARAFIEVPIDLFNLRNLPALSRWSIGWLFCSKNLGLPSWCNLMSNIINLSFQGLFSQILMISGFITMIFFPSLSLGRCLNWFFGPRGSRFTASELLLCPIENAFSMVIISHWFAFVCHPRIERGHVSGVVHVLVEVTLSLWSVGENIGHLQFKL